jgi:hypothetical protein
VSALNKWLKVVAAAVAVAISIEQLRRALGDL